MTNPFAPAVPSQPQQQPQQGGNPFAAPAPAPQQAPPAGNPYANPYTPQQQPQQAPPAYTPPAQQTYAQPQQYAPPAQAAPVLDPNALQGAPPPPPSADGKGPKFENLYGRLVLFFPLSFESKAKNPRFVTDDDRRNGNVMQDQVTATIVVLDDGRGGHSPIEWGGSAVPPQPHTDRADLPYVRKGMWISQSKLIAQLRPYLPQAPGQAPGMVVGRPVKSGPEHNAPWYLTTPNDTEIELARTYLRLVAEGRYPHPLAA